MKAKDAPACPVPFCSECSFHNHEWAWEFLRRNREYRALVGRYVTEHPQEKNLSRYVTDVSEQRRFQSFGLQMAYNPAVPGARISSFIWHPDFFPMGFALTEAPRGEPGELRPPPAVVYLKPHLTREDHHRLLDVELTKHGIQNAVRAGRPLELDNLGKKLLAYDLWEEHHNSRGEGLSWLEIGQRVEQRTTDPDDGRRARDYVDTIKTIIDGQYKKLLQNPHVVTEGVPPPSPAYLGSVPIG